MIISKAGAFKMLRIIGIFCAIVMGFVTLVGTSESDVKDAAGIDTSFEKDADIELEPVTVEKSTNGLSIQAAGDDCDTMTIDDALTALENDIENLDQVNIDEIELLYVHGNYTASWSPEDVTSFTCSLTIAGTQSTTIAETAINSTSANQTIDDTLTQAQIDVINFYLANTDEPFTYCVVCDDTDIDSYNVTYNVEIGVTIKGEI